jgi:hypothetical protein
MQINIISGIWTSEAADFRASLPRNMTPIPRPQGISAGYLRPSDGIVLFATGPGADRGGINWNGVTYRVMGTKLVRVNADGSIVTLGDVGGAGQVSMDYSFDRLGIASGGALYYWDGSTLSKVVDPDIGTVLDVLWVDGYFMTTDGTSLVVTDLNDPMSVNPLRYGSSEADPDPIMGVVKWRGEVYAVNRYTIEVFNNIGGNLFPFRRNDGAKIERGAIGTHCVVAGFMETIAFVGGARNEPPAVWLGLNSSTSKISTREIDMVLQQYTEAELAQCVLERRVNKSQQMLYLHLPDQTVVYDAMATEAVGEPVWTYLDSGLEAPSTYRARNLVWCYDMWLCGDPTGPNVGYLTDTISTHYGSVIGWEFSTAINYNEGNGAIFHQLELVTLPGRVPLGADPVVWTSFSGDGETWSQEYACSAGKQGDRLKRLIWLAQGAMGQWRIQKFRGTSDAFLSCARLEAQVEPLAGIWA